MDTSVLPASVNQRFLHIVGKRGTTMLNMCDRFLVRGALDIDALHAALDAVIARHEALRTTLDGLGPRLVRHVHEPAPLAWRLVDLEGGVESTEVQNAVAAEESRPFDVATDRPIRATLFVLGPDVFVVSLVVDHLAADKYSFALLLEEMAMAYGRIVRGEPVAFPELRRQYSDFVQWQSGQLTGDAGRRHHDHWATTLAGAQAWRVPEPPAGAPVASCSASTLSLGPTVSVAFARRARGLRTTVFALFLAALARSLVKLDGSASDDLTLATVLANRPDRSWQGTFGLMANFAYLRLPMTDADLRGLSRSALRTISDALEHQAYPVQYLPTDLVGESHARSLAHTLVLHMDARPTGLRFDGLDVAPLTVGTYDPPYGIEIYFQQSDEAFDVDVFRSTRADPAFTRRLVETLHADLVQIAGGGDERRATTEGE